ncbi:hypothetical protein R1sor_013879 [Riccia sorocarpa]|uniref:SET domain-containing protein n=1 Tax=Riccia sorocarpa TaxID=122646 RepID=A0ABD3H7U3_9MARC
MVCFQIFFTHDGKGWGLRTLEQLPAGAFVCECVREILTNMEQEERNNNAKADVMHTYGARRKLPTNSSDNLSIVCEYVGEIQTNMEQEERNNNAKADPTVTHTYPILLDGNWCSEKGLKDEEALCLDTTFFGNAARFINHRCCDGNLVDVPVTIESPDRHYYHVSCQQIHLITLALSANT